MIQGKPHKGIKKMESPCSKSDCRFYRKWGIVPDKVDSMHEQLNIDIDKWIVIGNIETCLFCKRFDGFDLYLSR